MGNVNPYELAQIAYDMAVSSTGADDKETPKIVYPDKGLPPVLGTMDCQAFVEACLKKAGYSHNWTGSNAMWRDMAWRGTPEECKKQFGKIPVGAWIYIWKADTTGIKERYQKDGLGNATHVGIYTAKGKGAAHSSSTRKGVCQSAFAGKTISNGGWNRIGLPSFIDYGLDLTGNAEQTGTTGTADTVEDINAANTAKLNVDAYTDTDNVKFRIKPSTGSAWWSILPIFSQLTLVRHVDATWDNVVSTDPNTGVIHNGYIMARFLTQGTPPIQNTETPTESEGNANMKMEIYSENGLPVRFRSGKSTTSAVITKLPVGTIVDVVEEDLEWSKITANGRTGYIMSRFLREIDIVDPDTAFGEENPEVITLESLAARVKALEDWKKTVTG